MMTMTPDDDDDLLVTIRTLVGGDAVDASTDIRLVDTDKASTAVNLSFSTAGLGKNDATTDIVVTATLEWQEAKKRFAFPKLVLDEEELRQLV